MAGGNSSYIKVREIFLNVKIKSRCVGRRRDEMEGGGGGRTGGDEMMFEKLLCCMKN